MRFTVVREIKEEIQMKQISPVMQKVIVWFSRFFLYGLALFMGGFIGNLVALIMGDGPGNQGYPAYVIVGMLGSLFWAMYELDKPAHFIPKSKPNPPSQEIIEEHWRTCKGPCMTCGRLK